ncbi:hypothetical protein [Nocardiopsis sp. FR4]|uniref:hypothetical protein n=1 Tax=Nocardiopsis sp. FR4 TaxID=2605985 RepID=UPI00135C7317|nr:hypothetical protein [Nocardiopsis sp. FR4]
MIYVFTLTSSSRRESRGALDLDEYFTHTIPPGLPAPYPKGNIALVFVRYEEGDEAVPPGVYLEKLGVILDPQGEKVATVGKRIKVDVLRDVRELLPLLTLQQKLDGDLADRLWTATEKGVYPMAREDGEAVLSALRGMSDWLDAILEYLGAALERDQLEEDRPEDRFRMEERDAMRVSTRIAGFPSASLENWRRPADANAPYLAGLVREPTEQGLIDRDAHPPLEWGASLGHLRRHDIEVLTDGRRTLEITNVNATPVEGRLGTDLIYYHHNTRSFVFVQYKRLPLGERNIWVDARLREQMNKLEALAALSTDPASPEDWRLSSDPCFVKLAQWTPEDDSTSLAPTRGLYLPVSYIRLLLDDPRTRGPRGGTLLGYDTVPRYLANTEFIELVKTGLVGTVGTSVEDLDKLVTERAGSGRGVVVAVERGNETAAQRQARNRSRGSRRRRRSPRTGHGTEPLF